MRYRATLDLDKLYSGRNQKKEKPDGNSIYHKIVCRF